MFDLVSVANVWARGAHNAFTDLCFFNNQFYIVFREASAHVSNDGTVIVLSSPDGEHWALAAELSQADIDLRDPKITETPDHRLVITTVGVDRVNGAPLQSYLYCSDDGVNWSRPLAVGEAGGWIWRTRFFGSQGYGVAYYPSQESTTLYSMDWPDLYSPLCAPLFSKESNGLGYPNEHDLFRLDGDEMYCLLRRDADTATAQLGVASSPYCKWQWRDLGVRIGGPAVLRLSSNAVVAAVRLYEPARTSICLLDTDKAELKEVLSLPSNGDTSYAGLAERDGYLWCSYYSAPAETAVNTALTAIYIAKIRI